mmetsp:Transcript_2785/g.5761  ORF Transcript_2785/g.5761 Transcript_2785/m.5761 type:complete len:170 (-) Transcript_2785:478-987(-)
MPENRSVPVLRVSPIPLFFSRSQCKPRQTDLYCLPGKTNKDRNEERTIRKPVLDSGRIGKNAGLPSSHFIHARSHAHSQVPFGIGIEGHAWRTADRQTVTANKNKSKELIFVNFSSAQSTAYSIEVERSDRHMTVFLSMPLFCRQSVSVVSFLGSFLSLSLVVLHNGSC